MAAVRYVIQGLWRKQVLTARICTRLTAQPTCLFSSESGNILKDLAVLRVDKMALLSASISINAVCIYLNLCRFVKLLSIRSNHKSIHIPKGMYMDRDYN